MADLQELLARLNSQSTPSGGASAGQPSGGYQHPSVSSPIFSPSPSGPQPHHQSAVMSPNTSTANTPAPDHGNADRQNSLLNLLRFNAPSASHQNFAPERPPVQHLQPTEGPGGHGRTTSASDLVASFMRKASSQGPATSSASATSMPTARAEQSSMPHENPQDLLLRLLNHPKPSAEPVASPQLPEKMVDEVTQDVADAELEDLSPNLEARSSKFAPESLPKTVFTYVNPFDQLSSASPRNRTPAPEASKPTQPKMEILKPKHDRTGSPSTPSRKVSPGPAPETVAEVVTGIAEEVDKQVTEALAQAEDESNGLLAAAPEQDSVSKAEIKEVKEAVHDAAVEIQKELEDPEEKKAFEAALPKPMADALKEVVDEVAHADVADSWESAEAEDTPKSEDQTVYVYRFPMRAFASITVNSMPERALTIRPDSIMDIARLKKDFDQIDRSLVAASKNFIVHALAKNGGFRIIRQENGTFRQVFQNHQERIFNVAICTAEEGPEKSSAAESILGIGVNGTVLWTSIVPSREDQIEDLDGLGLILPPSPAQDDNTSGGQLKTRAKPSSRHPDYFAVGRGKSIHIVWPQVAANYIRPKSRVCNTEKYLKERSLKILTGKAGKDFAFSEDDSVIVSLDKAGRMRFWDIRPLTEEVLGVPNNPPTTVEVSQTLLEFHTTSPTAKSWPTSVFFFDKDKPFNKGIALRYVMVGMKQNHTFQLWDLGLGKAVQEINLPHEKESDAICSVAFHPKTGIMAVGHPTRNSIYFIHVSCPRYNLPVLSQAGYLYRLANKNLVPPLPAVSATAIMTSITEYSFASKGQLRSLHMLNEPLAPPDTDDPDNNALFELYVMASNGVCAISVKRSDIGWKKEGEALHPIEAEEEGMISIAQLRPPQVATEETSTSGDTPVPKSSSERSMRESIKKESSNASRQSMTPEAAMRASTLAKVESKQDAARAALINGGEKTEKKKKKRAAAAAAAESASQPSSTVSKPSSYAQAAQTVPSAKTMSLQDTTPESATSSKATSDAPEWAKSLVSQLLQQQPSPASAAAEPDLNKLGGIVQTEVTKSLNRELETLYKRFEDDKRVQAAAHAANQDAVLRLVSSTLTDNLDKVLIRMVNDSVRNILLPQLMSSTVSTLQTMKTTSDTNLAKEIPASVTRALKDPAILGPLVDQVSRNVTSNIRPVVSASVDSLMSPAFAALSSTLEHQIRDQLRQAQVQHQADSAKIDQLSTMIQTLLQQVQSMASSQVELQNQIVRLEQNVSQSQTRENSVAHPSPRAAQTPKSKTPLQLEAENITRLMSEGKYEQGTMAWLQSQYTSELFDQVLVKCNPTYLEKVSTLLALSTGAVVTEKLETNLIGRLVWLDAVLSNVNPKDPEIVDIVPRIMEVLNQRLTDAYIKLNETAPGQHSALRNISALINRVREISHQIPGRD
jgi:WD40 repeat protein